MGFKRNNMAENSSLTASAGAEGMVGFRQDESVIEVPLEGLGFGQATMQFPTGENFDLALSYKIMAGIDSFQGDEATLLGGAVDRWVVYRSRFNLAPPYLGVTKFNLEGRFVKPGLKFYGGISPQEDYVYPYNFNAVTFEDGTSANSFNYSVLDNTSGANIYTGKIGFVFGTEWMPPFAEGLRLVLQTGPDGGFQPIPPWVTTAQVGFGGDYQVTGEPASSTLSVYGSLLDSPEPGDPAYNSELPADKKGAGFFYGQKLGPMQAGFGYAFNVQDQITTHGANAAMAIAIPGDRVIFTGAYSYMRNGEMVEHTIEPITFIVRIANGFVMRGGYFLVAPAEALPGENDSQHLVYLGIGLNKGTTVE